MTAELLKIPTVVPAYTYRAIVEYVYDGDSITCSIDLGFGVWMNHQKLRLYGIDTPEMRGEERPFGITVRDFVRDLLPVGSEIIIHTLRDKSGKYGRWLAVVHHDNFKPSLNQVLLDSGRATPYFP